MVNFDEMLAKCWLIIANYGSLWFINVNYSESINDSLSLIYNMVNYGESVAKCW